MDYTQMIATIQKQFLTDKETADAMIKSVLGHLISLMPELSARDFTRKLPQEISYAKLRGHLSSVKSISIDHFVNDLERQFNISLDRVKLLVRTVFHFVKSTSSSEIPLWERSLPLEWVGVMEYMEEKTEAERTYVPNLININKADREQLSRIGGIGKELADKLIRYREEHGGFRDLDEIDLISGMDKTAAEKIKEKVYIGK